LQIFPEGGGENPVIVNDQQILPRLMHVKVASQEVSE
jgi:hypothetical protein